MPKIARSSPAPLKVFISYSRRDAEFADRLTAALKARGFEVLIDRQDLPKLEDWERELLGFIRQSDTVIFIVSPHSVASKVCTWEVDQVRIHGKRLAPVLIADVSGTLVPPGIAAINYLSFTDGADFEKRTDELASALNTDVAWLKEHTRIGQLARRWDDRRRPSYLLLRGRELNDAELWAVGRPSESPELTELHREFLAASDARRRTFDIGASAIGLPLGVFAFIAFVYVVFEFDPSVGSAFDVPHVAILACQLVALAALAFHAYNMARARRLTISLASLLGSSICLFMSNPFIITMIRSNVKNTESILIPAVASTLFYTALMLVVVFLRYRRTDLIATRSNG